jgi:hypothetical protein
MALDGRERPERADVVAFLTVRLLEPVQSGL